MSTNGHDNNQDHGNQLVEGSGIKAKPILVFLAVLGLATASVFVIIKGLEFGFKKMDELNPVQPATSLESGRKLPPAPRLQGAPEPDPDKPNDPSAVKESLLPLDEMKVYRKQINELAKGYGWVDQNAGVARIPIQTAKDLVTETGLPKLSDAMIAEFESAEKARKQVMNSAASAGRGIKGQPAAVQPQASAAGNQAGVQPAADQNAPAAVNAEAKPKAAAAGKQ